MSSAGTHILEYQGARTALPEGESLIGSGAECTIRLEGEEIESVHAALIVEENRVRLEARSESSGNIRLNEAPLHAAELRSGDSVRVGDVELKVAEQAGRPVLLLDDETYELQRGENKVGREPECSVSLDHSSVSRYHAALLLVRDKLFIRDLGSTNSTFVNGRRLGEAELEAGDRIDIAGNELILRVETTEDPLAKTVLLESPTAAGDKTVLLESPMAAGDETVLLPRRPRTSSVGPPVDPTVLIPSVPKVTPGDRKAALAFLGLPSGTSVQEVRLRFQKLFEDYERRLHEAATPREKDRAHHRLDELHAAFGVLVPSDRSTPPPRAPQTPTGPAEVSPRQPVTPDPPAPATADRERSSPPHRIADKPRWTMPIRIPARALWIAVGVALLVLVVATGLLIGARVTAKSLGEEIQLKIEAVDLLVREIEETRQEIDRLERRTSVDLENGQFKICNQTGHEVVVTWLSVAYLVTETELETFDSAFFGYPKWIIPAGEEAALDQTDGDRIVWDGSVHFFTLQLEQRGEEKLRAGSWQSLGTDCYRVTFD